MRWQDENPVTELIAEGVQLEGAYLTVARVGEDRKEAQIGSQPTGDAVDTREWLDRTVAAALGSASDVRLRIRLWRADRTPMRGITTRVWPGPEEASDAKVAPDEPAWETDDGNATSPPGDHALPTRASASVVVGRPAAIAHRSAAPGRTVVTAPPSRPRPVVAPTHAAPCPTCASGATTAALLQSRISELSAMLGTAQTAVRDARRDAEEAKEAARARSRRAKDAETEVARLRSENAELLNAVRRLRRENRELHEGAAKVLAAASAFDD